VIIATPHDTHRDLAVRAMDAGKHVVVDKIMCMNAREAQEMIDASGRNSVLLSVFHNRRWDGDYLTVKKVIQDGWLGDPYLFEAGIMRYGPPRGWRGVKAASGGILYDWPAHFVDQALQLVPAKVTSVFCEIVYRNRWETDIGNYAKLLIRFASDVLYQIEIGNLAALAKPRWYVVGDLGALIRKPRCETATSTPQSRAPQTVRLSPRRSVATDKNGSSPAFAEAGSPTIKTSLTCSTAAQNWRSNQARSSASCASTMRRWNQPVRARLSPSISSRGQTRLGPARSEIANALRIARSLEERWNTEPFPEPISSHLPSAWAHPTWGVFSTNKHRSCCSTPLPRWVAQ
jgi:hypothetical protein